MLFLARGVKARGNQLEADLTELPRRTTSSGSPTAHDGL
jgi:hypothetical protein